MKKLQITLPAASQWGYDEHYAENLRVSTIAGEKGCVPVGLPKTMASSAGSYAAKFGDSIMTIGSDGRTVAMDGTTVGTLGGNFLSALADGERILIFTDAGVEWISDSTLHGSAPDVDDVSIAVGSTSLALSVEVVPPTTLSGTYTRSSEALQSADCDAMIAPVAAALLTLSNAAARRGMLTQPSWVSWRMIDVDGRVVARGTPVRVGELQGNGALVFTAAKSDGTVTLSGTSTMSLTAYGLTLSVARSSSSFWRRRVSCLEVILWADCVEVSSTTGHLNGTSLTVTPLLSETERSGGGIIAARIDYPLDGVTVQLSLGSLGYATEEESVDTASLQVSALHAAGSINAYALSDEAGVLCIAPSADPLSVAVKGRICRDEILRICSPAGAGGGWNYGRHHLLVFARDGVFAVSVDSSLTRLSATPLCADGIARADGVTVAPGAIYAATSSGGLLRIKGARIESLRMPVTPEALIWCEAFGELWFMDAKGCLYALDEQGGFSARTALMATRFFEPAMAVSIRGALCDLAEESPTVIPVQWRRRTLWESDRLEHTAVWHLDAEQVTAMALSVLTESGGSAQRALQLNVEGPVNAPVRARFRAPQRSYLTATISGITIGAARFRKIELKS